MATGALTAASISSTALAAVFSRSATSLSNSARKASTSSNPSSDFCDALLARVLSRLGGVVTGDRQVTGRGVPEAAARGFVQVLAVKEPPFRFGGAETGREALSLALSLLLPV